MPTSYGNPGDRGGCTFFVPAETGFSATPLPVGPSFVTGPIMDVSAFDRFLLFGDVSAGAGGIRVWPIPLAPDGTELETVDAAGSIFFTIQPGGKSAQDMSSPPVMQCGLVKLRCYSISVVNMTCTIWLACKRAF